MSLIPENAPERPSDIALPSDEPRPRARNWQKRLLGICFAVFTFEVGLFLVIFPWMDYWNLNYFQGILPALQDIWDDPYFRGAVTGLGFVNIYIACLQVVRLIKRA